MAFSLASGAPATLELFDIAGRRVLSRAVGALGAGDHVVGLGGDRHLPAGVYLLRLSQGTRSVSRRALVTR